jgi:hypothetical protein
VVVPPQVITPEETGAVLDAAYKHRVDAQADARYYTRQIIVRLIKRNALPQLNHIDLIPNGPILLCYAHSIGIKNENRHIRRLAEGI